MLSLTQYWSHPSPFPLSFLLGHLSWIGFWMILNLYVSYYFPYMLVHTLVYRLPCWFDFSVFLEFYFQVSAFFSGSYSDLVLKFSCGKIFSFSFSLWFACSRFWYGSLKISKREKFLRQWLPSVFFIILKSWFNVFTWI